MQAWKSPIMFVSLFAVSLGLFFLIGGTRTGIAQIVVPVSLAFTTICLLGGVANAEIAALKKRIEVLEGTQRVAPGQSVEPK